MTSLIASQSSCVVIARVRYASIVNRSAIGFAFKHSSSCLDMVFPPLCREPDRRNEIAEGMSGVAAGANLGRDGPGGAGQDDGGGVRHHTKQQSRSPYSGRP